MDKRSLVVSLLLLALGFVGAVHTIADFAYGTGLSVIGIPLVGIALIGLVVVNRLPSILGHCVGLLDLRVRQPKPLRGERSRY